MLGESPEAVSEVIKTYEEERVILRYSAVVDWDKVESGRITAVIDVKVVPQREVGFDAIAERIYRFPEVKSVYLMSGAYDLQVIVEGYDIKEVSRFVSERLATIENVNSTTTHFMLKTYKEAGVIFDDGEGDRRLVISP
ncbi:Lrp/AsnC family transcriptional regulator [Alicyclobacillus cycloheptanicus]|nr:Lrp/AsnC family transcriptional regulator [Alicyclobacillus cycloheptanicus]